MHCGDENLHCFFHVKLDIEVETVTRAVCTQLPAMYTVHQLL